MHKWLSLVYHKCATTESAAQAESWSCNSLNPLQQSSPHSSMRHCLVKRRNDQQVLDCWDGNLKQPSAAAHLTAGWTVRRQQSADTHYLQWTTGVSCTMWLILNRIRVDLISLAYHNHFLWRIWRLWNYSSAPQQDLLFSPAAGRSILSHIWGGFVITLNKCNQFTVRVDPWFCLSTRWWM